MARRKVYEGRRICVRKAPRDHTLIGLCVMYCGTGYRGLQLQTHAPTHHTVEGVIVQALKDIGIIDAVERGRVIGDAHHFSRSCRTDRGVHAVRNVISLFVATEKLEALGGCEQLSGKLNAVLPLTVRVARVSPLMGNFIPRFCCNRRVYRYLIPAYALLPPCDTWKTLHEKFPQSADSLRRYGENSSTIDLHSDEAETWISTLAASVARGNEILQKYVVGTHRFHNFSVDLFQRGGAVMNRKAVLPNSGEAVRTVSRCEIAPRVFLLPQNVMGPTMTEYQDGLKIISEAEKTSDVTTASDVIHRNGDTIDGVIDHQVTECHGLPSDVPLPFVVFQIEGNSFLFNMIRKIVGMTLAVIRGARETIFEESLSTERRLSCPLAPGPYLYLYLSSYQLYDRVVRNSGSLRFHSLEDEWCGVVSERASQFATTAVAADIVDLDLNRTPSADTLLAARDVARRITRPCWEMEDSHLSTLKEYHPATAGRHPVCSEMTAFLRSLRVHNWCIETVKKTVGKQKVEDEKTNNDNKGSKEEKEMEGAGETVVEGNDDTLKLKKARFETDDVTCCKDSNVVDVQAGTNNNDRNDDIDDGWLYVAPTEEEEKNKRREYHQNRERRFRAWEHKNTNAGLKSEDWNNNDGGGSE
ncbi:Pseudouridine synthase I [Trypanosoma melophagium]|uniref:Pseudouridine synthase I n=1 Tax=Trypanosoma melophagium TaxID=715481 RepID=UPI00351A4F4B|nr:Pseudouridine synthase I [Trypanosoma melophagium]